MRSHGILGTAWALAAAAAVSSNVQAATALGNADGVALFQDSVNVIKSLVLEKTNAQDPEDAFTVALESENAIDGALESSQNVLASMLETGSKTLFGFDDMVTHKGRFAVKLAIPMAALAVGLVTYYMGRGHDVAKIVGQILVYFGTMSFMNIYMKAVMSSGTISVENHWRGFPAAFAITGMQQITALVILLVAIVVSKATPWPYRPKLLTSRRELLAVLAFSFTFMVSIALNNFSVALLPFSVNLIIRSCSPLLTAVAQVAFGKFNLCRSKEIMHVEWGLMIVGVSCAALATIAQARGASTTTIPDQDATPLSDLILGVILAVSSLLAASVNFVLGEVLGDMHLNPLDTVLYMAAPVFVLLLIPIFCIPHPVWGGNSFTDWQITKEVVKLSPGTFVLALLSGVFALIYNVCTYAIIQTLSATYAAFAGNFNKAATIFIAILVKLEVFPSGSWGTIMLLAIFGDLGTFTLYSWMQTMKERAKKARRPSMESKAARPLSECLNSKQ